MADPTDPHDSSPTLSDVLGAVVTSLARARVQADLATVEVAQLYQQHELLRVMPVPRLRINRVEVSLPVVVTGVHRAVPSAVADPDDAAKALLADVGHGLTQLRKTVGQLDDLLADTALLTPDSAAHRILTELRALLADMHAAFERSLAADYRRFAFEPRFSAALRRVLELNRQISDPTAVSGLELQDTVQTAIRSVLTQRIAVHRKSVRGSSPPRFQFAVEQPYSILLGEMEPPALTDGGDGTATPEYAVAMYEQAVRALPDLVEYVARKARVRVFTRAYQPPEVEVAAHTAEVKNLGSPGTITRINVTLSEEGLEWVAEASTDGGSTWKLVTE